MSKGILTHVLRSSLGDCTNNGLSSKEDSIVLVGEGIREQWETENRKDYLVLEKVSFRGETILKAVPASLKDSGKMYMFGGNYCVCSKSNGNITDHPIKIHDRVETSSDYLNND